MPNGKQTRQSKLFATRAWLRRKAREHHWRALLAEFQQARMVFDLACDHCESSNLGEREAAYPAYVDALFRLSKAAERLTR